MPNKARSTSSEYVIGVDVGGTKIAGGIVALTTGVVTHKQLVETRASRGANAVLEDAMAMVHTLLAHGREANLPISGSGIGVPELVDPDGNVTSHQTLAWDTLPVQKHFAAILPAVLESDVRAAALAEAWYGARRDYRQFVYVTVGTGISHTLVVDGKPFTGARGSALGFASSPLTMTCPHCGRQLAPVLENEASGPALVRRYNEISGSSLTRGEAVVQAVIEGDVAATAIVESAGAALGVSVAWLVNVLDPEAVIVGGGLGLAGGLYWASFVASTREHIWADNARGLPIVNAGLNVDAGIAGAAAAFWQS